MFCVKSECFNPETLAIGVACYIFYGVSSVMATVSVSDSSLSFGHIIC